MSTEHQQPQSHDAAADTEPDYGEDSGTTEYNAEAIVDLRRQRLRPSPASAAPSHHDNDHGGPGDPADQDGTVPDPYGVGQHNLRSDDHPEDGGRRVRPVVLKHADGVDTDPAEWGWRGRINTFGTRLRPPRDGHEVAHRRAVERIRQPLPGTPVILVANPKGGTGVTPVTVVLANAFGVHRGGSVVAWDANESRGTLAARAAVTTDAEPTVVDVLANARALCSPAANASSLARYLRLQPTLDEVLASDQSGRIEAIGRDECAAIMAVLRRQRSMVLIDSGDNDHAEPFCWLVENATQLVVPLVCRRDAAYMALRMLDTIAAQGRRDLVTGAVVTLAAHSGTEPAAREAIVGALEHAGITRILDVPFDPVLAGGDRIVWSRLAAASVRAWTQVAAAVADGLADGLTRMSAPLEAVYLPEHYRTPSSRTPQNCRCFAPDNARAGDRCGSGCPGGNVAVPHHGRPYSERR
ncbi:MAG: ParA family protein [Mycobacteriaceae bacterium]|nr:ParA family protein [Mycobacteriaceae bacterium]